MIKPSNIRPSRRSNAPIFPSPQLSGVKAILFDCDGVLCPPMRFAALLERDHQITREMTADFFRDTFPPALRGEVDVADILPKYFKEWGWNHSVERFLELWLSSEREVRADVVLTVQDLRRAGYLVGAATNQESRRANYLRTEMNFDTIFDRCFISSELGVMKPQPEYFTKVTDALGAKPDQVIFIDDQQHYLDAASACGWGTILFRDTQTTRESLRAMMGSRPFSDK